MEMEVIMNFNKYAKLLLILGLFTASLSTHGMQLSKYSMQLSEYMPYVADGVNLAASSGRFIYHGLIGIQAACASVNLIDAVTISDINKLQLPDEMAAVIEDVFIKMKMNPKVKITKTSNPTGSPAVAAHNCLGIDVDLLSSYTKDEQAFTIAHECAHIKKYDQISGSISALIVPILGYGILKGYELGAHSLLSFVQQKYATQGSLNTVIQGIKVINAILSYHFVPRYLLNLYLQSKHSRYMELRADKEAAIALNNADAGINFFKRYMSPAFHQAHQEHYGRIAQAVSNLSFMQKLYISLCAKDCALGMPSHPSEAERIKALEEIKEKMKIAKP